LPSLYSILPQKRLFPVAKVESYLMHFVERKMSTFLCLRVQIRIKNDSNKQRTDDVQFKRFLNEDCRKFLPEPNKVLIEFFK